MIRLESNDGQQFLVDKASAYISDLVRNTVEDVGQTDEPIILPNVRGMVLAKIIEYCTHHKDDARILSSTPDLVQSDSVVDAWDRRFMDVDDTLMLEILSAADYLSIEPLVELGCTVIAKIIRSLSVDDIRQRYGIEDDFTDEQRIQIQKELAQLQ
ncbi:hypothetical protein IW140_004951 [Coemansia sp. RSA 1813]|nr:hypothetical protein EV178_004926 [Coemansia sp. RSA 1646]KAJ1770066.1 hypothetical protein LPJ74_003507 [Coemansia sp. RSA 1843]KAJ2212423.1 hypothetical protein EV179_004676 [Coemansia sp. RSA 487]KAJ2566408.1 hypothetical protein IW140_004951 [Coemansia sp. RSA 1813]